jgi:hypothetical protein
MSSAHLKSPNNKKALLGLIKVPKESESLEGGTPEEKLQRTYRKANNQACNMLLMALDDETSCGAVSGPNTEDLPEGDTNKAMLAMVGLWKLQSTTEKHKLEDEFNNSKLLEVSKSPDKWFQTLAGIVIRLKLDFGIHYDNKKVMGHVLHNLKPKEYK